MELKTTVVTSKAGKTKYRGGRSTHVSKYDRKHYNRKNYKITKEN